MCIKQQEIVAIIHRHHQLLLSSSSYFLIIIITIIIINIIINIIGNHEDLAVNRVYGFESEVRYKYDSLMFDMFEEVFNHIPLFTIINRSIFVVHAGLFHTAEVTLDDLQEIDRYVLVLYAVLG